MQILTRFVHSRGGNLAAGAAFALGAALSMLESRPVAAQVPEVGVWINHEGKGAVEIKPCGSALCGNIVWLKVPLNDEGQPLIDRRNPDESKRARPICGLPVIGSVKRTSDGWDEGWIYNPEEGAQYDVAIRAAGDRLTVTGYKGVKLFSKTFTWTRAPADLQRCDGAGTQTKAKPAVAPPKVAAPKPRDESDPRAKKPAVADTPAAAPARAPAKAAVSGAGNTPGAVKKAPAKDAKASPAAKPGAPAVKKAATAPTKQSATATPGKQGAQQPAKQPGAPVAKKAATAVPAKAGSADPQAKTPAAAAAKKKPAVKPAAATAMTAPASKKGEPTEKKAAAKPVAKKKAADEADASSAAE